MALKYVLALHYTYFWAIASKYSFEALNISQFYILAFDDKEVLVMFKRNMESLNDFVVVGMEQFVEM